ncbi:uncharacterized protein E0L32_011003 [Thyridium curvatum]|uniref:Uncharacterized protein n=1 Tax=Thyridium curvatum TaxID=1093900 RepID=A0A507AQF0_9PEZI|nr:uncharacterized protein E0L32_011003 [Thyridium curvatum]TPX07108.1 hypothetical protein E0L32_011003 [Thyridium curvatum]
MSSTTTVPTKDSGARGRVRDIVPGIHIGDYKTGPKNGITDVPGVLASTQEFHLNGGRVNTGVTVILPRRDWCTDGCNAGMFRLNGAGEFTGSHWIAETGMLSSPIVLTNTTSVGGAYQGIYEYANEHHANEYGFCDYFLVPVIGETYDGYLNDLGAFPITPQRVAHGIATASDAPVPEGNRGGGTGMICQGFKGGTGTASRIVPGFGSSPDAAAAERPEKEYTVAALVQANYGRLNHLRIAGVPVGRIIADERAAAGQGPPAADRAKDGKDGSIVIVVATDAPLSPTQCQRLAKRAAVGLARVGGYAHNPSGDIFLAFSTGNHIPVLSTTDDPKRKANPFQPRPFSVDVVEDSTMNGLFEAAADATEEAIYNVLCMAETLTGLAGHTIEALPLDKLREIMDKYMYKSP